jgi:hypothetical protein
MEQLRTEDIQIPFWELCRTTDACPVQWEGFLDDGRAVYIRYRGARFRVYLSEQPTDSVFDAVGGKLILTETFADRDRLDGYLSDVEAANILKEHNMLLER